MMKKGKKTEDVCPLLVNRSGHSEVPRIASLVTWRPEHNNARSRHSQVCVVITSNSLPLNLLPGCWGWLIGRQFPPDGTLACAGWLAFARFFPINCINEDEMW